MSDKLIDYSPEDLREMKEVDYRVAVQQEFRYLDTTLRNHVAHLMSIIRWLSGLTTTALIALIGTLISKFFGG